MSETLSNTKRIAKNTFALYARTLVNLVVSLYTSRVVLATLGIEDYGIYGVVGGITGMLSFLNAAQSGATSRYISFDLGKKNENRLKETFGSALLVHIGIALIVALLAETVGVWFLHHKLIIPEGRMNAAEWLLQISIISSAIGVIQTPFISLIIAYEKMNIYAYIEMLYVFMKLGIVYLLLIGNFDKLILYSILILAVVIIIFLIYLLYCFSQFHETRGKLLWGKDTIQSLLTFSGFNLFGNMGSVVNLQGTNFAINMVFGVAYNAAAGIASTVSGAVEGFASNIITAFRPQITKDYAREDFSSFEEFLDLAIKVILSIYCIVAIPVILEIDKLLDLWLAEVPVCTGIFCRFMLVNILFCTLRYIINIGIHATARVKVISLFTGTLQILNPFVIWILYKRGMGVEYTYLSIIFVNIILSGISFYLLHKYAPKVRVGHLVASSVKTIMVCLMSMAISFFIIRFIPSTIYRIVLTLLISFICILALSWCISLDNKQKTQVAAFIKSRIKNANDEENPHS